MPKKDRPVTPDSRYLVARGVLKRCTNPSLSDQVRRKAVKMMMQARMSGDKQAVLSAKTELGEAGPVWWADGAPDYSGITPADSPYAKWWTSLDDNQREAGMAESRLKS